VVVCGGVWWCVVVCGGVWWCVVVCGGGDELRTEGLEDGRGLKEALLDAPG
jgi:hypothetical protein